MKHAFGFSIQNRESNVASWFLQRFARQPLSNFQRKMLQFTITKFPMFPPDFAAWNMLQFSMENRRKKRPLSPPDFCTVLLGYPLAILHETCFKIQCQIKKSSKISPAFCSVLLDYPLAILHEFLFSFSMKNIESSNVFSWSLQRFARLPPSNFAWKFVQFSMKT